MILKTIQDILDAATDGNLDNLMTDLKGILVLAMVDKKATGGKVIDLSNGFKWTDDGINRIDIHKEDLDGDIIAQMKPSKEKEDHFTNDLARYLGYKDFEQMKANEIAVDVAYLFNMLCEKEGFDKPFHV